MSRLRKRQIIPEDTHIRANLTDPKIVHGKFGRQVEAVVNTLSGTDDEGNDYKGTTFKTWFSFGQDNDTKEEYIAYGGPLYRLLSMTRPNLDEVLEDEELSNKDYEKFLKKAVRDLDDMEIVARVGVKTNRKDESKKSNFLQNGTFGPYVDPNAEMDEESEKLDMGKGASKNGKKENEEEDIKTPIDDV
jgi:hypothetical protein